MSDYNEDITSLIQCTCLDRNPELELEDLVDADFADPACPIHGDAVRIKE